MKNLKFIFLLCSFSCLAGFAYLDTTGPGFQKPKRIAVKPYSYSESEYDKYIDTAAGKVAPKILTNMIGPVGVILNMSSKAIEMQEKQAGESR